MCAYMAKRKRASSMKFWNMLEISLWTSPVPREISRASGNLLDVQPILSSFSGTKSSPLQNLLGIKGRGAISLFDASINKYKTAGKSATMCCNDVCRGKVKRSRAHRTVSWVKHQCASSFSHLHILALSTTSHFGERRNSLHFSSISD